MTDEDLIVLAEEAIDDLEKGSTRIALDNLQEIRATLVNRKD